MRIATIHACLCLGFIVLTWATPTHAQSDPKRGLNERLFVMPTPGEVTVDGKLDDWDRSGEVFSYHSEATRQIKHGRMSLMYDDEALYIGAVVADPNPMMNRHDPAANPDKVWNADSVQVRLVIDRDEGWPVDYSKYRNAAKGDNDIQHLLLWYYTDGKRPGLQLRKDMDFKVPEQWQPDGLVDADAFDAAYRKHSDGLGYTLEYRVPWNTLDANNPPRGGDMVAGSIQYNWSKPDGLSIDSGKAAWARDIVAEGGFPYQSATVWGKFIFAQRNHLPAMTRQRTAEQEPATPLRFNYDLPEAGVVTVSLWDQDNVLVRRIAVQEQRQAGRVTERWDGLDYKGDPIPPGTYQWKGLYHEPIKTEHKLSVHNAGTPPWKTSDGTGGWGGDHGNPTTVEAYGDQMILAWKVAEAGFALIRVDAEGDKKASSQRGHATILTVDEQAGRVFAANHKHGQPGVRLYEAEDFRPINFEAGRGRPEAPDNDHDATVTGLAYTNDRLYVAYRERNQIAVNDGRTGELLQTWNAPQPGRLTATNTGDVLAICGDRVMRFRDGQRTTLIGTGLDHPKGIDVDDAGRIYITQRGGAQNVAVFDASGKRISTIGKRGGRPRIGRYEPGGMLEPAGCAIDGSGRLWVAESIDAPKRISVWDTDTGKNTDEFFGASAYSPMVTMDPNHPGEVYCHNVLWKIDLDTGAKRPHSTLWRSTGPNVPRGAGLGFRGGLRVFTATNGRQYMSSGSVLYKRDGAVFKPIVALFDPDDYAVTRGADRFKPKHKRAAVQCAWVDADGDQTIELDEVTRTAEVGRRGGGFRWVDASLNLYTSKSGHYGRDAGHVWRAMSIDENGLPRYDFAEPAELPFAARNQFDPIWVDPHDGSLYQNSFAEERGDVAFGRWSRDGERLWGIPGTLFWKKTLSMPKPGVGQMYGLTAGLGVAGEFTGAAMYYSGYHLLTRDGLYVGMLMNPPATEGLGPNKVLVELFTGQLVRLTDSGRYLLLTGDQDGRIMEVHGLDTIKRLPGGTWRMTPEKAERVAAAQRKLRQQKSRGETLIIHRGEHQLNSAEPIRRETEDGASVAIRAAHDADNLYLRYDVSAPAALTNNISDPQTIFLGGNCIDLQLAANPAAPADRTEPAPGDQRLLITRQGGKTLAVRYTPNAPDAEGDPIVFDSPVDEETFDRIQVIDNVKLDYKSSDNGFTATATIPLDVLSFAPAAGTGVQMDVGYIFGDKAGRNALKRVYWSNNGFEANVVNDLPDESRLNPEHWGTAIVE